MRKITKLICGITAAAIMLTACGSGTSESKADSAATSSAAEETVEATPTPEPTEAPTPAPTEEPTLSDLEPTIFKISDLSGMLGKSSDEIEAAYPDTTFITDDSGQIKAIGTKGQIVDAECRVVFPFIDGKAVAALAYFDLNDATSLFVGEKYMKIRNTVSQSMGDPVVAYDPGYTDVSASQIGMAFEDGKEVNEKWVGDAYSAETYIMNAEDSAMIFAFYTQEYEYALG